MRITAVEVFAVEGEARHGMALYETARGGLAPDEVSPYRDTFTEIQTDAGITGLVQGGWPAVREAGQLLIGQDPFRIEHHWDRLYAGGYHRLSMPVIARLDLALWDLVARARGESVCRLLGGPTRDRLRAYAGMLGFATDPERAARSSAAMVEEGFTALKWYLPANATAGAEGLRRNVALVQAVRRAVGDDVEIMVDCILSDSAANALIYATELARRLEEFRPTWIEEPLASDDLDAHARLAKATRIPIALGERLYTRWQVREALEKGAAGVLQPDPNAAGGLTELRRIISLAAIYGVPVVPHANESCRNNVHLLFASPERTCPLGEWGVKINHNVQHFFTDFYAPVDGYFVLPSGPGFGYELDPAKVRRRVAL